MPVCIVENRSCECDTFRLADAAHFRLCCERFYDLNNKLKAAADNTVSIHSHLATPPQLGVIHIVRMILFVRCNNISVIDPQHCIPIFNATLMHNK